MFDERTIILSIKANSPNGNAFDCQSVFDAVLCAHMCVCVHGKMGVKTRSRACLRYCTVILLLHSLIVLTYGIHKPMKRAAGKVQQQQQQKQRPGKSVLRWKNPRKKGKVSALGFAYGNNWGACVWVCMSECSVGRRAYDQFLLLP